MAASVLNKCFMPFPPCRPKGGWAGGGCRAGAPDAVSSAAPAGRAGAGHAEGGPATLGYPPAAASRTAGTSAMAARMRSRLAWPSSHVARSEPVRKLASAVFSPGTPAAARRISSSAGLPSKVWLRRRTRPLVEETMQDARKRRALARSAGLSSTVSRRAWTSSASAAARAAPSFSGDPAADGAFGACLRPLPEHLPLPEPLPAPMRLPPPAESTAARPESAERMPEPYARPPPPEPLLSRPSRRQAGTRPRPGARSPRRPRRPRPNGLQPLRES